MVRFALSPDNVVTPDISGKLPGRGVWVHSDRETLETAVKKGAFARGFKQQVIVPEGLSGTVETLLLQRLTGLLEESRGYRAWLRPGARCVAEEAAWLASGSR